MPLEDETIHGNRAEEFIAAKEAAGAKWACAQLSHLTVFEVWQEEEQVTKWVERYDWRTTKNAEPKANHGW